MDQPTTTAELTDRQRGIYRRIQPLIVDRLSVDPGQVTLQANFIDDLQADSLDLVEVVLELDKEFNINTSDSDSEKIHNLWDAIKQLDTNLPEDAVVPLSEEELVA